MSMLGEVEVQVLGGDPSRGVMEVQEVEVEVQEGGGLALGSRVWGCCGVSPSLGPALCTLSMGLAGKRSPL